MSLTFDEASHTYQWNGQPVPGCTTVLAPLYDFSMVKDEILNLARERGDAVHKATELLDQDDLAWDSLDARIVPYVEAWKAFKAESGWVPVEMEQRVYHTVHRYAGTFDRVLWKNEGTRCRYAMCDIKTVSQLHPATAVQTAAYAAAYERPRTFHQDVPLERCAVKLQPDGRYRLKFYEDKGDFGTFLSLLNIHRFKERNKT